MLLSKYYEIQKGEYSYIQIIPHKSIRNYNSSNIAKAMALSYKTIDKLIRVENKKLIISTNLTFKYIIDIRKDNCSFYFKVPKIYLNLILEKINEIWSKATLQIVDSIDTCDGKYKYYLTYKKHDGLSLNVDKKSNNPLNIILNVCFTMDNEDFIRITNNFTPISQSFWKETYEEMIKKVNNNDILDKNVFTTKNIAKKTLLFILNGITTILEIVSDLFGSYDKKEEYIYESLLNNIRNHKELSNSTKNKRNLPILNANICIEGNKYNNVIGVCQSYSCISEDNELIYSKNKRSNLMSIDECQNLIQIPANELLKEHKIKSVNNTESKIPKELLTGTICLGENTYKGIKQKVYCNNDKEYKYLTLLIVAPPRAGKSTYIENVTNDCVREGECVINFDFCGECKTSYDLCNIINKKNVLNIECSDENNLITLDFCEMDYSGDNEFIKYKNAKNKSNMFVSWIDNINVNNALEPRMLKYLKASCVISFYYNKNFNFVFKMLTDLNTLVNMLNSVKSNYLEDYVLTLNEIIERKNGTPINIRYSYVSGILSRLDIIKSNPYMELMLKNDKNSVNLLEEIKDSGLINLKINESMFTTDVEKDIYCLYWCIKIWGALQQRIVNNPNPTKVNLLFDELYQVPLTQAYLKQKINQIAKKKCKLIISCHSLEQIKYIRPELKSANTSYMLLSGCNKDNYKELKEELEPYELDDLLGLKRYYSLNLIKTNNGYSKFITKLPKPIC